MARIIADRAPLTDTLPSRGGYLKARFKSWHAIRLDNEGWRPSNTKAEKVKTMKEYMILVPTHAADATGHNIVAQSTQTPFPQIVELAVDLCGGATLGPVHCGHWRNDEGELVSEDVRPLFVASQDEVAPVAIALAVKTMLNQQCVYLRKPCGEVEFI